MPRSELATRSESARATAPAQSRFRITAPNSLPRAVKIVSLDVASDEIVASLAPLPWGDAAFFFGADDVDDAIAGADLVVLVATAGAAISSDVGARCRERGVTTMGLVVQDGGDAAATLVRLRPDCEMLVTTTSADCLVDLLTALRA